MNMITILIWITIAIIAAIAIISVKLHYRGDELEHEEGSIMPSTESINNALNFGKEKLNTNDDYPSTHSSLSQNDNNLNLFRNDDEPNDAPIVPEVENTNLTNYEYQSENQVLINYDDNVEKFQEPIKQNQMDIMTQNNKDTGELKDLFTIDELIKESKRKDSEREKESQKIGKIEDDTELDEIKQSIKNKTQEPLIEEVIAEEENKETSIEHIIDEDKKESEIPSVASQKDIDEAINTASRDSKKEEVESVSEENNITGSLLNQNAPKISEPALKTPNKVKTKDYELGASIDDVDLFKEDEKEEGMDLDYRKDLDKFTNKIKESTIFQEVKDSSILQNVKGKLSSETEELPPKQDEIPQDEFIRTVNEYEYDEYAPIINETHVDFDASYEEYHDQRLRQENTKRVFNMAKNSPEPEVAKQKIPEIKSKPARDNIKVKLNNDEVVLKKGDEIIFNHAGETYSSQVYAINGDDISVKYRRKNIMIKPSDIKKIY